MADIVVRKVGDHHQQMVDKTDVSPERREIAVLLLHVGFEDVGVVEGL